MIKMNEAEYKEHFKQSDGICATCFEWKYMGAEPDAENYYCNECANRTVVGVRKAFGMKLIEVVA